MRKRVVRENKKGKLSELFKGNFKQCNFLEMKKGTMWGGHYHKKTTEYFYVISGKIRLETKLMDGSKITTRLYKSGDSFVVDPLVVHILNVIQDTKCVALYTKIFTPEKPDLYYP